MNIVDEIKGRFRNEYHKGAINLIYTVKNWSYDFQQVLKKRDISEPQYNVLRVLRGYSSEGPSTIGFLKERMLDKNSDVSRLIDRLYIKGLVNRKENHTDRRQKSIEITNEGISLLESLDELEKTTDTFLQNLNISEVNELNRILDKIRD